MGLELVLTEQQMKLIMSRVSNRGYIFVSEEGEKLIATKVVPVKTSRELILLEELDEIESMVKEDETGYLPYIFGGSEKNHEKCAFRLYHDNNWLTEHAAEIGIPDFVNRFKGYGEVGEYERQLKFARFVQNSEGVIVNEEIKLEVEVENGA